MTKFEVGKSYALHLPAKYDGKATFITDIYTVTKRTPCYLTFSHISHDGTKMPHCRCKIFTSDSRGEFVHATAFFCLYADSHINDDSQHELPATADDAISANDNDTALASQPAAVANAESSQPDALYMDDSFSDAPGDNSECARNQDFPVDIPNSMPDDNPGFTIWSADNGSFVFPYKSNKQNLSLSYTARLVHLGLNDGNTKNYQGDYLLMFYDNNGNTSHPFALYAPMCNMFNFNPTSAILYDSFSNQDNFKNHVKSLLPVMLRGSSLIDENGEIISDGLEAFRVLFFKSVYLDTSSLPAQCRASENFIMPDNPFTTDNDKDNPLSWRESPYRVKALRILLDIQVCTFDAQNRWQGNKSAVKKLNKRIKALTADLHKLFDAQNVAISAENPGFTIVPSEHIERPQYTTYPDTITDECPYVTVPACDIPENHSHAAVVPYNQASGIRCFLRLIAIYIRLWFASHIIPADFVFPVKIKHSYFSVGFKYPAWINHKKQFLTVTDRKILDNGRLDVRVNDEENGSFGFTPWTDERGNEYTYFPRWSEFCYASQGVRVKRRSNAIKFNLGLTYPALRNNRLYANATVIAFDDTYSKDKNGKIKLTRHDIIFKTDCEEKSFKHIQTWTRIENGVELAEYNVYPSFNLSADCPSLGSKSPELPSITPLAVFSVGCDYTLDVYEKKYTVHITARTKNSVSFTCDMLKANRPEDTRIFTAPITIDTESKSEIIYLLGDCRADNPDPVQEIPAETREITPKPRKPESAPASVPADIEHKLIDTKELHFAEKRKALDHNAAVITSCMFPEAVISLLMSISAKAVIQLGFHMGLFIAKPKGKKNVIAELFAQRLIARRDIRANIRSKSDNTAANNTANVPDGVKFFVGARRQICFKFED